MSEPDVPIFQIKVALKHIKPPIWRRLLVRSDATLADLHDILQAAMGWHDGHLHLFKVGDYDFSRSLRIDVEEELDAVDSETVRLVDVVPHMPRKGRKSIPTMEYEYDFGDGWDHKVEFEHVLPPEPGRKTPVCIKGARACPPEDCGGPHFYTNFLDALKDPSHPEHEVYTEWLGEDFDPEAFDLQEINDRIEAWVGVA